MLFWPSHSSTSPRQPLGFYTSAFKDPPLGSMVIAPPPYTAAPAPIRDSSGNNFYGKEINGYLNKDGSDAARTRHPGVFECIPNDSLQDKTPQSWRVSASLEDEL
uniref:Uncharacterized protein n=1 Tax=Nelumbo nucifera TaxID=4432 RepID=A0A822ZQ17_NELNU|nr:TPA_asm: hypothetical protein HUJ06_018021 [Nelumbo nucifera]